LWDKIIIEQEYTGRFCQLSNSYGKLPCNWGINWFTGIPINYPKKNHTELGFVSIYVNCFSLFNDNLHDFVYQELHKVIPSISVHFYDVMNSTFYFLPDEAEEGLKKLEQWYVETKGKCDAYLKEKRKIELQKELEKLG
jgi:hypothetical protein